jgi:DNA invertase Pin-like site-specific DNA recombinase
MRSWQPKQLQCISRTRPLGSSEIRQKKLEVGVVYCFNCIIPLHVALYPGWDRPELNRLIERLHTGAVLVAWKLDRLSRSLKDLLLILERIEAAGAGFRSLTEAIDTTTPADRTMMQMLGSFAEYERAMVLERTQAGLREANAQGRHGGRKPRFSSPQRTEILTMLAVGRSAAEVAKLFRVHRATVSRINVTARTASTVS